jgi:hypothetical protein
MGKGKKEGCGTEGGRQYQQQPHRVELILGSSIGGGAAIQCLMSLVGFPRGIQATPEPCPVTVTIKEKRQPNVVEQQVVWGDCSTVSTVLQDPSALAVVSLKFYAVASHSAM